LKDQQTPELLNNGSDGLNPFATVESVANKSLQDVINVNKVADRVDLERLIIVKVNLYLQMGILLI
jgi:hypothetical protein